MRAVDVLVADLDKCLHRPQPPAFLHPYPSQGVAVDADGNVLVADLDNRCVRCVSPAGTITTLAGGWHQGGWEPWGRGRTRGVSRSGDACWWGPGVARGKTCKRKHAAIRHDKDHVLQNRSLTLLLASIPAGRTGNRHSP